MAGVGFSLSAVVKSDLVMAALRRADKNAQRDARAAMRQAVREVMVPGVKSRVPHGPSGNYQKSIKAGASTRGGASIFARTAYAKVLEEGRRPLVIRPKSAKALSTPNGVFRVVHSPRYPARHVLRDAVHPLLPATAQRVEQLVIPKIKAYF